MSYRGLFTSATALAICLAAWQVNAADHLDAPNLQMVAGMDQPGDTDINDLYAFQSPSNPNNSVLVMTVNPFAGLTNPFGTTSPTTFGSDVTYSFNVDNNGDAVADITYGATFTAAVGQSQMITLTRDDGTLDAGYASGATETQLATSTGGSLQAGLFDDPFFFDFFGFQDDLMFTGENTFAGADVSAIVLEIPSSELTGADSNIGVWATTTQGGTQVDRVGRPGINTVLIPSEEKQNFNEADPANDVANFTDEVETTLTSAPFNRTPGDAMSLSGTLLPDILTFDTASAAGFLNGRRLEDDVIDAELNLLTDGALTTDMVANDSAFTNTFPYLASPNNPIPEPSSMALVALAVAGATMVVRRRW
jgi:hypothetical protein